MERIDTATKTGAASETSEGSRAVRLDPRTWAKADVRIFSSASDAARARRPTDLLLLILGVVAVTLLTWLAPEPGSLDKATTRFLDALPGLLGWFWEISYDLLVGWALFLLIAALVSRRRKRLFLQEVAVGAVSFLGCLAAGAAAGLDLASVASSMGSSSPPPVFPGIRLAVSIGVIVSASPHLSRPLRYLGRWIILAGALGTVALGVATPAGVVAGLAIGVAAACLSHLVVGSPGGRLPPPQIAAALADLGVETSTVREARLEARGAQLATATATDGRTLAVKIYGRDAWDGQLLASIWTGLWYRDETTSFGFSRMQQVEHEAFVTLLAERAGVSVFPVIAAGLATGRDALLVIEMQGDLLATRAEQEAPADEFVRSAWEQLAKLHTAGIAHGQIDAYHLAVLPDGSAALLGFGGARVAAADSFLMTDRAQLLITSALAEGPDRAVAAAAAAIGNDGLAAILPFLQAPALTAATRRALHERDLDLDDVRKLAATQAAVEVPKLEQIRRVTLGSVLMVALIAFLAYALISAISGVGLQNLLDELSSASGPWLWIALLCSPLILVPQAIACMGATERPVSLGPLIALESAIQFIQLAVPSSAARIALNIRFFQRAGATTTAAVAIGMIDGFAGFCVEIMLLLTITLTGLGSLNLKPDGSSQSFDWTLVVLAGIVVVIAAAIALAIPRVRAILRARVADSRVALRVFHSPKKVSMLVLGNLTVQLLMALILGLCLRAFGQSIPFADLILIVCAVQLFAGFMPVPGGIGVAEAAYTACLVAAGVPQTTALAAALTMRLVTYYLPPIWGGFAMKWLRSHSYV